MHEYLNEHQRKAVEALSRVKSICEKYNIQYFLLAGSVLGAVRHKGFIPWDDDIDVGVFCDDWYRLRKLLPQEMPSDFVYMDNIIDSNYPRFLGNILYQEEPVVDVFMIVKWTSNKIIGNIHWQIKGLATSCYKFSIHYPNTVRADFTLMKKIKSYTAISVRKIIYFILHFFCGRDDFIKIARWNEKYFMNTHTDYYINLYSIYKMEREMIKKTWLLNPSEVYFEGDYYTTVSDPNAYLIHLYGNDYMTLPKEKYRVRLHGKK